jgi:hypothetical protein
MTSVQGYRRLAGAALLAAILAVLAPVGARAQTALPACSPDVPPAFFFVGLPQTVVYGRTATWDLDLDDSDDSGFPVDWRIRLSVQAADPARPIRHPFTREYRWDSGVEPYRLSFSRGEGAARVTASWREKQGREECLRTISRVVTPVEPMRFALTAVSRQDVLRQGGVVVSSRCTRRCSARFTGKIVYRGASIAAFTPLQRSLTAGKTVRVKLSLTRAGLSLLRRARAENRPWRARIEAAWQAGPEAGRAQLSGSGPPGA